MENSDYLVKNCKTLMWRSKFTSGGIVCRRADCSDGSMELHFDDGSYLAIPAPSVDILRDHEIRTWDR